MTQRKMKDSGVAWIGQVPEGWSVGRAGFYYQIQLGKMLCGCQLSSAYTRERYFCAANVHYDGASDDDLKEMWFLPSEYSTYQVLPGDMLVVEGGAGAGGCAIVGTLSSPAYMQNSILRCRAKSDSSNSYLCYWLEYLGRSGYVDLACNKATIPHFTKEKLSAVPMPLPTPKEQRKIAAFLDGECGKIDVLRGKVEKQIAALEEYRKSVITEAVTKGIKRGRKMKPSGVEWIGEVPDGWNVSRVKYVSSLVTDGSHLSPETENGEYDFVSIVDVADGKINFESCLKTSECNYKYCVATCCKPQKGDVLISKDGSVGKTVLICEDRDFVVASSLVIIRPKPNRVISAFLNYNLQTKFIQDRLQLLMHGAGLKRVSVAKNANLVVVLPPIPEQREIAAYLDRKCAAIDSMVAKCREELDRLAEYKKSLIYEYVTGKKEVA